jgi:hypothetical protein
MSGAPVRGLERVAADRRHLVAAQVRCSTGFTQGPVAGVAIRPARRRPVAAEAPAETTRGEDGGLVRNGRFARWLVAPVMALALALWTVPGALF